MESKYLIYIKIFESADSSRTSPLVSVMEFSRQIETIIQLSYFKSADFTTEKYYKPVSTLNSVSKSFEKLIQKQQNSFFKRLKKSVVYHPRAYDFSGPHQFHFYFLDFLS